MTVRRAPGRPVEVDPESIALVATKLFDERGLDDVTMTEIAEAAGVSRRTLFRWFPTKASLVWGGTVEADQRFEHAWMTAKAAREASGDTPHTLFEIVREAYAASITPLGETSDITRLRLRLIDRHPELLSSGQELRAALATHLAAHLASELGLSPDSLRVATLTSAIGGVSYTALTWWARTHDSRSPADVLDEALHTLAPLLD